MRPCLGSIPLLIRSGIYMCPTLGWARDLIRLGYVTVMPNSFTPRGRPRGICLARSERRIRLAQRSEDAYGTLGYLQSLPFVDPHRIVIIGGSSTLATIVASSDNSGRDGRGFAAAVALYPAGDRSFGDWSVIRGGEPKAPLLILIVESADWTPVEPCRRLADAARAAGYPVEMKTYSGAHHAFDSAGAPANCGQRPEQSCAITTAGTGSSPPASKG